MTQAILVLNSGSSSIKAALYPLADSVLEEEPLLRAHLSGIGGDPVVRVAEGGTQIVEEHLERDMKDPGRALDIVFDIISPLMQEVQVAAVGHRVVHGGQAFSGPVLVTEEVLPVLERLSPLAPGHQPHNLAGVRAARHRWPAALQTASFDTAFHRTQPLPARQFALPKALSEDGIERYGFHGLSYDYIAETLPGLMGDRPRERVIVAHLGSGASMCALKDGRSIATTMGFTALDGLPMATRCGDIDPGVLIYLLTERAMPVAELADCLNYRSGLLGLSDISGDMRVLQESSEPAAREAIDYFVYRCGREIGSLAAALGGLDALVFTAGIGENSSFIRQRIMAECAWLGVTADDDLNDAGGPCISAPASPVSAWAVPTDEEIVIAREAAGLIG